MAKCEKIEAVPLPPPPCYLLELTAEEAGMLLALIEGHVAGAGCQPLLAVSRALNTARVQRGNHRINLRSWSPNDATLLVDHPA